MVAGWTSQAIAMDCDVSTNQMRASCFYKHKLGDDLKNSWRSEIPRGEYWQDKYYNASNTSLANRTGNFEPLNPIKYGYSSSSAYSGTYQNGYQPSANKPYSSFSGSVNQDQAMLYRQQSLQQHVSQVPQQKSLQQNISQVRQQKSLQQHVSRVPQQKSLQQNVSRVPQQKSLQQHVSQVPQQKAHSSVSHHDETVATGFKDFDAFLKNSLNHSVSSELSPSPLYFLPCLNEGNSPNASSTATMDSFFPPSTSKNICLLCGKNYARPSTLKTHMRIHSGERPFHCKVCNKSFSQAANLTAHARVHSGEKPFSCCICQKTFSQSSSVTTHMRTHSGDRPYKCPLCRKGFSDSSTLTKHMRIHSGEKPYKCNCCSMSFSQSGNLNRHLKVHDHSQKNSASDRKSPRSLINSLNR